MLLKNEYGITFERRWIPVEERLPLDDRYYLVTDGESMMVAFYRKDAKAWDNENFGWIERESENECPCRMGKIKAWMPLLIPPNTTI